MMIAKRETVKMKADYRSGAQPQWREMSRVKGWKIVEKRREERWNQFSEQQTTGYNGLVDTSKNVQLFNGGSLILWRHILRTKINQPGRSCPWTNTSPLPLIELWEEAGRLQCQTRRAASDLSQHHWCWFHHELRSYSWEQRWHEFKQVSIASLIKRFLELKSRIHGKEYLSC